MRGLLPLGYRTLRAQPLATTLPWRDASGAQVTEGTTGRGRGQRNVNASKVFASDKSSTKSREDLAHIVSGWKKNKPRAPQQHSRPQQGGNQLDKSDLSKILGDVINRRPDSAAEEDLGAQSGSNESVSYESASDRKSVV